MPSKEKYDVVGQKDKHSKDSPASSTTSGGDEVKLQKKNWFGEWCNGDRWKYHRFRDFC